MNYSRKEIISWVQSQSQKPYKFEDLKNGVFFCQMLLVKFPEEAPRFKFNHSPLSEYECLSNLTIMKKVLTKYGLQQNLNINTVVTSKNNFELAKWFKGLIDNTVQILTTETHDSNSQFQHISPHQSLKQQTQKNLSSAQFPVNRHIDNSSDKGQRKLESNEKNKNKKSSSNIKRLSVTKSEVYFYNNSKNLKKDVYPPMKPPKHDVELAQPRLCETQIVSTVGFSKEVEDDINALLYERALEESIESLSKLLGKIQNTLSKQNSGNLVQFQNSIHKALFSGQRDI